MSKYMLIVMFKIPSNHFISYYGSGRTISVDRRTDGMNGRTDDAKTIALRFRRETISKFMYPLIYRRHMRVWIGHNDM